MKKSLIIVLLITVMSGAAFAQELKFDGYINSGVGLVSDNNEDNEAYLKAYATDAAHRGYRFRLNGSYTNEAKNAGARFRLQSQTNLSEGYFSLPYAFGWVSFFDNIITLNGGIVEDGTWSTGDFWLASNSVSDFTGLGTLFKLTPFDGLALGVGFYPINRTSGSNNNVLNNLPALGTPIVWYNSKYTVHGAYTLNDVFRIDASWRNENKAGVPNATTPETSILYGEFRLLAVTNLTAVVAASLNSLGEDFDTKGNIIISETFAYKVNDNLNLGLNAVEFLYNRDKDFNPGLFFNLWGSFAINNIVPRLDLVYFMGGRSNIVDGGTNGWDRWGFANVAKAKADKQDLSVFSIRPSVKFNLDSKTFLEIGDMINFDSGNWDGAYAVPGDLKNKSRLTNVFYIDLKWSF